MTELDEPTPEQVAAWDARDRRLAQWLTVAACAALAFGLGCLSSPHRHSALTAARGVGYALGTLLLPAAVALVASRFTDRWHYAFAAAALLTTALAALGSR